MKDFFENLGKKITETAEVVGKKTGEVVDSVSQKTGEMVEEQKIKSQIRTLKKGNNRDVGDMGKMIYEQFKNGEQVNAPFAELCETIKQREASIEEYNKQIAELKGFDVCKNCQIGLEPGTVFCPKCGTKVEDSVADVEFEEVDDEDVFEDETEE